MEPPVLALGLACTDNPDCLFNGAAMPIEITVMNNQPYTIGFPRSYIQARGPAMKLTDAATGKQKTLKIGLANHALKTDFTVLKPGERLTLTTVVTESELTAFRREHIDLTADISVSTHIRIPASDKPVRASATGQLRITGK